MTADNRTNEQLAERLRQFAESQAMDFDNPHIAMTLEEIADRLTGTITEATVEAAAKGMWDLRKVPSDPEWAELEYGVKQEYRKDARAALAAAQGAAPAVSGSTSDGYHTFDELYEYRMLYNAHAAHGWLAAGIPVVKSWRHSDGEECFGGGRFIVTATLPSGQVSNHYKAEHWELFKVPEVDLPPEYDGHTPQVAAERLRAAQGAARPVNGFDTTPERVKTGADSLHVAPVPSSGVDEDALAEVIEDTIRVNWEVFNNRKEEAQIIARAVAEWLEEQGVGKD